MSAPACLDLSLPREQWAEAVRVAADRGSFRGAVRHEPYPPLMERLCLWLVLMAAGQGSP